MNDNNLDMDIDKLGAKKSNDLGKEMNLWKKNLREKVDLEPTKSLDNLRRTIQGGSGWLAFGDRKIIPS